MVVTTEATSPAPSDLVDSMLIQTAWSAFQLVSSINDPVALHVDQSGIGAIFIERVSGADHYIRKVSFNPPSIGDEWKITNWPAMAVLRAASTSYDGSSNLIALSVGMAIDIVEIKGTGTTQRTLSDPQFTRALAPSSMGFTTLSCIGFSSSVGGFNLFAALNGVQMNAMIPENSEIRIYGSAAEPAALSLNSKSISSSFCGPVTNGGSTFMMKAKGISMGIHGMATTYSLGTFDLSGQFMSVQSDNDFYPSAQSYMGNPKLGFPGAGTLHLLGDRGLSPAADPAQCAIEVSNIPSEDNLAPVWEAVVGAAFSFTKSGSSPEKAIWITISKETDDKSGGGVAIGHMVPRPAGGTSGGVSSSSATSSTSSSSTVGGVDGGMTTGGIVGTTGGMTIGGVVGTTGGFSGGTTVGSDFMATSSSSSTTGAMPPGSSSAGLSGGLSGMSDFMVPAGFSSSSTSTSTSTSGGLSGGTSGLIAIP